MRADSSRTRRTSRSRRGVGQGSHGQQRDLGQAEAYRQMDQDRLRHVLRGASLARLAPFLADPSQALSQFGTDFEMIAGLFPHRTRRQIKAKFNREDKLFPQVVTDALMRRKDIGSSLVPSISALADTSLLAQISRPTPKSPAKTSLAQYRTTRMRRSRSVARRRRRRSERTVGRCTRSRRRGRRTRRLWRS